jgi:hypothetical protein
MKSLKLIIFSILLYHTAAYATLSENDLRQFKEESQTIGKSMESSISSSIINNQQSQETIGFEGTNIRGNGMSIEELDNLSVGVMQLNDELVLRETQGEAVTYECTKNNCNVGHTFSSLSSSKRQEEIESQGFGDDQSFLDKALKYSETKEFDFLNAQNIQCPSETENLISTSMHTCDQFYDLKTSNCFPKQLVEIDPEYKYSCLKTRDEKIKTCNEEITDIKCRETQECDMGGIEKGTLSGDMKFELNNGVLTIGTIADNYWGGYCAIYDRATTFKITHKDKIKDFTLFKVGFDDYLSIHINNHLVYVGPDGGNKLEVKTLGSKLWQRQVVDNGLATHACERDTNWVIESNIDLKPYLKEGENIIKTRVIVAGHGEGWLQIRAKQNCCVNWDIKRATKCNYS